MKPLKVKKSRNANYKLLEIVSKFKPVGDDRMEGTCANIREQIEPWGSTKEMIRDYDKTLCGGTSAPYLLARLCALFEGLKLNVGGQEFYKTTWETILEHKKTGHVITFYDCKSAASYGSDVYGDDTPKEFIKDVKALIKVLKDERCPHPYDGCVVGEVA